MLALLLLTIACTLRPGVGDPGDKPDADGNTSTDDTGTEDTGPVDTGPPLPCDVPEVEPNNPYSEAQELPLEQWACGSFGDSSDAAEIFYFENTEPGWIRTWARAFEIGSLADVMLTLSSNDGPYGASRLDNADSTDVMMVIPVDDEYGFYATLNESFGLSGDEYRWEFMASEVKAPVEWSVVEDDDNDTMDDAMPVADGDRVFAKMNTSADIDWYRIELPEGRVDLTLDIDGWQYGSPADTTLFFYRSDGTKYGHSYGNSGASSGGTNADPKYDASPTSGGTWYIKIFPDVDDVGGSGGAAYWYVLDVSVEQ